MNVHNQISTSTTELCSKDIIPSTSIFCQITSISTQTTCGSQDKYKIK